jgi:hypothetical protein
MKSAGLPGLYFNNACNDLHVSASEVGAFLLLSIGRVLGLGWKDKSERQKDA